jgi:hypothetical protein
MATQKNNPLKLTSDTLLEYFKEKESPSNPNWTVGETTIPSTGGKGTVSQAYKNYLANIDFSKRTPIEDTLEFGSTFTKSGQDRGIELQEQAKKNIEKEALAMRSNKKAFTPPAQLSPAEATGKPEQKKSKKLYRVMYAGKKPDASEVYETKEEADAALKRAGGKGAVAGVNLSQETRGGEILPAEDVQARKQRYMDQLSKTKEISKSESDRLKKIQALRNPQTEEEILTVAENKGRMSDALAAANEAKRTKDKEAGAGFESWASNVRAKRAVEGALNNYNSQLGLLKKAYSQARQSGNPLAAYKIQEDIQEYQAGIPKEMGARKKFAESGALQERMSMLQQKKEEARQQAEKDRKLAMVNADFNR